VCKEMKRVFEIDVATSSLTQRKEHTEGALRTVREEYLDLGGGGITRGCDMLHEEGVSNMYAYPSPNIIGAIK